MKLHSYERYRASATERRLHGGKIVTKYLVVPDAGESFFVYAHGVTQHDRKRNATRKAEQILAEGKSHLFRLSHCAAR